MSGPREVLLLSRTVLQAFGIRGLVRRAVYIAALRTGIVRWRTPAADGYERFTSVTWPHRFDLAAIRAGYAELPEGDALRAHLRTEVDQVLGGRQVLYGALEVEAGWPPRWDTDPSSGTRWPLEHWIQVPDDAPDIGDIKDVWELSRLPTTFLLARAWAATEDDALPAAWWTMLEDWLAANPPDVGVNWRCGQETSLRAIAVGFGLSTFADAPASTPGRVAAAGRLLAASVARVRPTVGYALSQRNNHAVSELVLLLAVEGPRRRWCRLLSEVLEDQWYADGSYAQQSANYQRLAVQALQWLLTVRDDLPADVVVRIHDVLGRSAAFLARTSDPVSGTLSNMGANDGAHLLPLSASEHHDVRPLLASLGMTTTSPRAAEQALWIDTPVTLPDLTGVPTAWPSISVGDVHLVLHAGPARHRTGHADQLGIEVRVAGRPLLVDAGSHRYSGTEPWRNPFTGPVGHSTLTVAGEQTRRLGRFLPVPQSPGEVMLRDVDRDGHARLVLRRVPAAGAVLWRAVVAGPDCVLLLDACEGGAADLRHLMTILAESSSADVQLHLEEGKVLPVGERSTDDPASGWWSPHYGTLQPCTVVPVLLEAGGAALLAVGGTPALHSDLDAVVPPRIVDAWRRLTAAAG
jgi:hypothetical protein